MTNKLTPIAFLILLIGCGTPENTGESTDNLLENLQITTDTVMVDVGEEIFNAGAYSTLVKIPNQPIVYFPFNSGQEVHEIELTKPSLVRRIKFENDGPNQAPRYFQQFDMLPSGEFLIADFSMAGLFSQDAEKIREIKIDPSEVEGIDDDLSQINYTLYLSPDQKKAISKADKIKTFSSQIAVFDLENKSAKVIDLPALEMTKNFQSTFAEGNGSVTYGDFITLKKLDNLFFITSGATSDTYIYDLENDSLTLKTFPHKLVPVSKSGTFPSEVDSDKRVEEVGEQINQQPTYQGFFWDDIRKQYFRFATKTNGFNENGDRKKMDVFLFVYDKDLNLLGETKVDLPWAPYRAFFHDEKLYSYFVVEENPGFVVYDFNF
ncbi:DUF4221 family protein [Algoriphagus vanfongensis]|uniref:DUF4221 family protein n=1 Tax=Algoriphagus vanfongensis TaxID=426371 RepID=UPI0003F9C9D5|nr:DUF4221 family protein [Algoriphagus vanfongensis]